MLLHIPRILPILLLIPPANPAFSRSRFYYHYDYHFNYSLPLLELFPNWILGQRYQAKGQEETILAIDATKRNQRLSE